MCLDSSQTTTKKTSSDKPKSLISLIECAKKPSLVILPVSQVQRKPVGKSLMLTCRANVPDINLVTDLKWRDNKGNTIYSKQNSAPGAPMYTEQLSTDQSLALIITKLEESMAGNYYCSASYANTEMLEISVKIETFVPITWKDAPEEQYPTKGTDYLVKCEVSASPPPAVDWLRNGEIIRTGGRHVVDSRGLMIRNVKLEDDGAYVCRAVVIDTGELAERTIRVEVQVRPEVMTMPQRIKAVEGQSFSVKCNATGKPPPMIEWIKDRTQQNLAIADRFTVDERTGLLIISQVTDDDYGVYTCLAKNSAGVAEKKTMFDVLVTPKIYEFNNITMPVTKESSIVCKATGRPAPMITFRRWEEDEEFVAGPQPNDDRIILEVNRDTERGESTGILRISKLVRPDDGLYVCIARSEGGEAFKNGHIAVEYPPNFEHMKTLPPVYSWEQRKANLSCLAEGFPNATIEWRRDDKLIKDLFDPNLEVIGSGPRSDLIIKPVGNQYYRSYRCIAQNILGKAEHLMELRQAFAPAEVVQSAVRSVTATSMVFDIVGPPVEIGLPILAYHVQYVEERELGWDKARNRTWSPDSPYVIEGLLPERSYKFRFAARNQVGQGNFGKYIVQSTPKRSYPEPPKLLHKPEDTAEPGEDIIVLSPYSDLFDLRWNTPHDNGERIDYYEIKYCPGQKINGVWTEMDKDCVTKQRDVLEGNNFEMRNLSPESYYRIELRAHNAIGLSQPASLLLKTARGRDVIRHPQAKILNSSTIIAIAVGGVIILLIVIDLLCCLIVNAGLFAIMCRRTKRSPSDLDDETKIGREDEKQPLSNSPTNSIKKQPTTVEYDGNMVHSRSGEILGKNSADNE
uniref:CSON006072 protein n=1 Tax=Culicoides sonorensis TaxID=179676 RepID=A0A336MUJ8_CULSO